MPSTTEELRALALNPDTPLAIQIEAFGLWCKDFDRREQVKADEAEACKVYEL